VSSLLRVLAAWALACLALLVPAAQAQNLVPVPALSGRVIDQTNTLSAAQAQALTSKLAAIEAKRGSQLVVLIVPTTAPEDIESFTQRVGDAWKLGRRDIGDGLLIVLAKNDRAVRIAPAKSLEGAVPDVAAGRIISQQMLPAFRNGDFAGGLNAAIDKIEQRIAGEGLAEPTPQEQRGTGGRRALGFVSLRWKDPSTCEACGSDFTCGATITAPTESPSHQVHHKVSRDSFAAKPPT